MDSATLPAASGGPLAGMLRNPAIRQLAGMIGIAASVALGVAVILWSRDPMMSVLYAGLGEAEKAEVVAALDTLGIPYQLQGGSGAVMVPAKSVPEARLKLAAEGLPSQGGVGLELMQEDPGFGVSQFMENARYHHALETELSRTIASLKPVKSARVHLALARPSVFVRDRGKTTASVTLEVYPGRTLSPDNVAAVVHMVASSIPELESREVTVIDQFGRLLSSPDQGRDYEMSKAQFEHTRRVEENYVQRIESLLAPIVGIGRVRAQVVADLDFTVSEQAEEIYDPDRTALRSENTSFDERRDNSGAAAGVPGALSNQPPVGGNAAAGATVDPEDAAQPINQSRSATRNFEVDRTLRHTRQPSGEIRRLSVAVIVDDRRSVNDAGEEVAEPLTPAEVEQLTALVREAVGFDGARGDSIQVVNKSFQPVDAGAVPESPKFWETPLFQDLVKQGIGVLLVLLVVFKVLKPMSRTLLQAGVPAQLGAPAYAALPAGAGAAAAATPPGELAPPRPAVPVEQRIESARKLAADDPARMAQIVKDWVAEDGQ